MAPGSGLWAAPNNTLGDATLGIGSVLISLVYTPAKLFYAAGGSLTAVTAYALTAGRRDVFWSILAPAVRGDYVVTPEHLQQQRQLVFMGPPPEDDALAGGELAEEPGDGAGTDSF